MYEKRDKRFRLDQFLSWPRDGWLARPLILRPATNADRYALMRVLELAAETKQSLVPLLEALAWDEKPSQRWRLHRLISQLREGRTVPEALEATPGLLAGSDVTIIRTAYQLGLSPSLTVPVDNRYQVEQGISVDPQAAIWRLVWYVVVTLGLIIFVSIFMYVRYLPTFEQVLLDMQVAEPRSVRFFATLVDAARQASWVLGLTLLVVAALGWSKRVRRGISRLTWISRLLSAHNVHAAELLETMASSLAAGRPLVSTLSTLARCYHDPQTRHQLLVVRNELDHGQDLWEALQQTNLLGLADVKVIRFAERSGGLPWTLRKLATAKRIRVGAHSSSLLQVVQLIVLLMLGLCVLGLGMVVFDFLRTAVMSLTEVK